MRIATFLGGHLLRQSLKTNAQIERSLARLASGKAYTRASEAAATVTIDQGFSAQIRGKQQAERNIMDGIALTRIAEDGLSEIQGILGRMQELVLQGANGTWSDADRTAITTELTALAGSIDDVVNTAQMNGYYPLRGTPAAAPNANGVVGNSYVFLLDNSSTTAGLISGFLQAITTFAQTVQASDPGAQFGVSLLNSSLDPGDAVTKILDLTGDITQLTAGNLLGLIQGASGGSTNVGGSVDLYSGLLNSLPGGSDGFGLTPGAQHQMVVLTDTWRETDKLGASATMDETQNQVLAAMQAANVKVSAIGTPGTTDLATGNKGIGAIIAGTGGQFSPATGNLGSALSGLLTSSPMILQVGPDAEDQFTITFSDARANSLGVGALDLKNPAAALAAIAAAQNYLNEEQIKWGAYDNRLQAKASFLLRGVLQESDAKNQLSDADVPEEWLNLTRANILQSISRETLSQSLRLGTDAARNLFNA